MSALACAASSDERSSPVVRDGSPLPGSSTAQELAPLVEGESPAVEGLYDDSESSARFAADRACAGFVYKAEELPLDMFFLVDTSGSMAEPTVAGAKWDLISSALIRFASEPRNENVGVALSYFPKGVETDCSAGGPGCLCIPFTNLCLPNLGGSCATEAYATPDLAMHFPLDATAVESSIASQGLAGGTPTTPALQGLLEYASTWAADHPGRRGVVVLATDGDPTGCSGNDPADVATAARTALEGPHNIRTFVIGVGRSLTSLNLVAEAGGTEQAFLTEVGSTLVQDFADTLDSIRSGAVPCEYAIPEAGVDGSIDPNRVNLQLTLAGNSSPVLVPRTSEGKSIHCGNADGWYYDNPESPRSVHLCESTCRAAAEARVELQFGCETVVAPLR